jgi:hypothetical protein
LRCAPYALITVPSSRATLGGNLGVGRHRGDCSTAEDPANLHFLDVQIYAANIQLTKRGQAAVQYISHKHWNTTIEASSSSWYKFSNGDCHDHDSYVVNHFATNDGSHARFWQSGTNWSNVRSGAHHDHHCGGGSDTADDFNNARNNLRNYWWQFIDNNGIRPWDLNSTQDNPVKNWSKPCNTTTPDDGWVNNLYQTITTAHVN